MAIVDSGIQEDAAFIFQIIFSIIGKSFTINILPTMGKNKYIARDSYPILLLIKYIVLI